MDLFLPEDRQAAADGQDEQDLGEDAPDPEQAAGQADNRQDQAAAGHAGMNNNLFPHICHANDRKRCITCVEELPVEGHTAARNKLGKTETRCGRCEEAVCQDHSSVVCLSCKSSLALRQNNNDLDD